MNQAYQKGIDRFNWWPDWRGECVAIIAGGPSVSETPIGKLKDRIHVIAIKESFQVCPWAEIVYGCDAPWWIHRKGLPEFKGLKLCHGVQATSQFKDLHRVLIPNVSSNEIMLAEPLTIGSGGNSGFQAMNLAVQFGAKDFILIGFDVAADPNHLHWYGRNKWVNANNPMVSNFKRWMKGFDDAKKQLDRLGVTVINVSKKSQLQSFAKADLEETLERWGL